MLLQLVIYHYKPWIRLFFLSLGIPKADLLHTRSLRGHRDCFEKFHLIAKQSCPRSKLSKSTYAEVKNILSKKINWIIQYAQNKDLDLDTESSKQTQHRLFSFRHQRERKLLPQFDSQVPKYSAKWIDGNSGNISNCSQNILESRTSGDFRLDMLKQTDATFCCSSNLWSSHKRTSDTGKAEQDSVTYVQRRHPQYNREQCKWKWCDELNEYLSQFSFKDFCVVHMVLVHSDNITQIGQVMSQLWPEVTVSFMSEWRFDWGDPQSNWHSNHYIALVFLILNSNALK